MSTATSGPFRVRFAPSPTGHLHVGGARTALYCYLLAKKMGGDFILRVEDTDEARSTPEFLRLQLQGLQWLGLNWDEGPHPKTLEDVGENGPYRQSRRKEIYQQYADQLLASGKAFYCFMTDRELEEQKKIAEQEGRPQQVLSPYRDLPLAEAQKKLTKVGSATIRFKVSKEKSSYSLNDLIRGQVTWPSDVIGDFVLIRSSRMPVYNFCCVIDDALMKISHVFRAEEHLNNTLRQMMLFEALGFNLPQFAHMSIILGPDRQKLSKRHGATSCQEYQRQGYLPEAFNNFMALLGWSSPQGQEILSMEEMVEQISLDRFHSSPAIFDHQKLKWMNATYLRALSNKELWVRLQPFLADLELPTDTAWRDKALSLMKSYMETFAESLELFRPLSKEVFTLFPEAKESLEWESSPKVVRKWLELLEKCPSASLSEAEFDQAQNQIKTDCQVKGKFLFMPIRVAVLGKPHGAELKVLVPLLDKSVLMTRAKTVLNAMPFA